MSRIDNHECLVNITIRQSNTRLFDTVRIYEELDWMARTGYIVRTESCLVWEDFRIPFSFGGNLDVVRSSVQLTRLLYSPLEENYHRLRLD
jgi:hypothetical protein